MKYWKEYIGALIILLFLIIIVDVFILDEDQTRIDYDGGSFFVEVVDTPRGRSQGLSGRDELLPETGMFFIFPRTDYHGIWMKDMKFSIDILWIDELGVIVDIERNVHPDTYPEVFKPGHPARFVLEIPAGAVDNSGLEVGEELHFSEAGERDF